MINIAAKDKIHTKAGTSLSEREPSLDALTLFSLNKVILNKRKGIIYNFMFATVLAFSLMGCSQSSVLLTNAVIENRRLD